MDEAIRNSAYVIQRVMSWQKVHDHLMRQYEEGNSFVDINDIALIMGFDPKKEMELPYPGKGTE
jgi:hypothetical protein